MQAPNFNKAFRSLQIIALGSAALLVCSNFIWARVYFSSLKEGESRVYIPLAQGTVAAVLASNSTPSLYEARNHVRNFMLLMHAHDANTFEERINAALRLIDKSRGAVLYNDMKKGGVLRHYTEYRSRTEMEVDSIVIDMSIEPYRGSVYTKQRYVYEQDQRIIPIAADFELTKTHRSNENPFGLLITKLNYKGYYPKSKE